MTISIAINHYKLSITLITKVPNFQLLPVLQGSIHEFQAHFFRRGFGRDLARWFVHVPRAGADCRSIRDGTRLFRDWTWHAVAMELRHKLRRWSCRSR